MLYVFIFSNILPMLDLIAVSYWNIGPFRDKKISLFFEKGKYLIKAPIGSGKSFLFFDGITYGLYKSNSRNLLNIPSKIGTIKLIFEVDSQVFLVIRTLKHGKSKDSCSSQLFQIALTSEEVTEKLCIWEILQENTDIQDLLLSKNIPLEEIPFKNEADLQAQLNTLLPPIEVFSSTTILLQDAENIFEMQPAKRLEVLKNVFGLMGIEETKEIVKDKRNEVKYQIKAYQDTSHTEGKLSSGLQEMLTLFRKLQEFSEIAEYLSSSLETIEELEGFSQQLGIQNFELDEKLTEFLPSIAEFLKTKREILSAEKTELWLQNQQLTEIKNQISHFFNTIQSNENKIKQIDWLLANANPELLWELRRQKADIANQQEKLEQLSFSRELQTFYTQYHSILGLGHRENFSLLYNEQFVQELITLGTNLKKANELVASQASNLTTKQQVEKQKVENQLLNLENQYRFYQEQLQQIEQKLQQFEERVQQEQIFACEKIWANCPFITVINKQHFEQREQEKQQLLTQKQQIEQQISSSQILNQVEECKLTLANWEQNETFLKEHEKLSMEEQENTKKIWFLKTFLQSINYKQITEISEKYSELVKSIQALDQQILKQEELLAQTEHNQQEKLRLQSENIALQQQYSQAETKKSELEGKIWQLEQNIQKYPVQEWDLIEKTANTYQAKIQELRNLIEDYKTLQLKVKKLTEEEKILSNLYTILNKELLLFVLSEYLPVLSEIINTYLVNVVDYQISIKLKETSEQLELETKIIDSKWEREVKSLSWGQRTILKLVWMLAISSHLKTRLLFLDETINNLDNETVAKVAELLTDFVKQRTLKFYTITHNSDIQSMNIRDSTIELAKKADQ